MVLATALMILMADGDNYGYGGGSDGGDNCGGGGGSHDAGGDGANEDADWNKIYGVLILIKPQEITEVGMIVSLAC